MQRQAPPVLLRKCISRGHNEQSARCCQRSKEGEVQKASKWIPAREATDLAVKRRWAVESTCSLRGALCLGGKTAEIEKLWLELFSDPTQWRDHRLDKSNSRFPDFVHKKTDKGLWLDSKWIPLWVKEKVAALSPGTMQLGTYSWNQRLLRCAQAGQYGKTMELFQQMQQGGTTPDKLTVLLALKACASLGLLEHGRRIHTMMRAEFEADLFIGSSIVDMYAKCGSVEEAEKVFNEMPIRNIAAWNAMISGYVKCREGQKALKLFEQMQYHGVDPDSFTFVGVLNACASITALEEGRRVHEVIIQRGHEANVYVSNGLIDMYGKCRSVEDAERVFKQMLKRDVVTWNAMIQGYVKCGKDQQALELYRQMQQEHVDPTPVTFVGVLNACASASALEEGKSVHEAIIQRGFEANVFVSNGLIDMYGKCGSVEDAERVFKQMPSRDVVSWTAMILGCVKCGKDQQALELYRQMPQEQLNPDPMTFVAVLNACASVSALEDGRGVHEAVIHRGYEANEFVQSSLINMYGKCGSIEDAEKVFTQRPTRSLVAWNAMLAAYASHGYAEAALEHFKEMCEVVEVDEVTFISLLTACSHGGLVDDGLEYFKSMTTVYKVSPTVEHYTCVVDLLGRANRLREAEDLIMNMPMNPNAVVWMSLLGACRAHVNVEVGECCAKQVIELDPESSAGYALLSDIYAAAGKSETIVRFH